ncbi:MAG TPA: DUF2277 domain-containing protein [Anaerolineales bacterium]|nr:DUF2277 domain-containing protein [Anaerolineales bacterium]
MCRNIKKLRDPERLAGDEEVRLAALQYVRKVSGYRTPSRANALAFEAAVDEIAASTGKLLARLVARETPGAPSPSSGS